MNSTPSNSETPGPEKEATPRDNTDLTDSAHDQERMKEETFILDLPDVSDIPGQEHVHVPSLGELSDITASSDDEEGVGLFDDEGGEEDVELNMGNEADVSRSERKDLKIAAEDMPTQDNFMLREAALDNRDDDGDALNEGSSATRLSGKDLDVPGAEGDDHGEDIGEEDEENNSYSLGSDEKDDIPADEF